METPSALIAAQDELGVFYQEWALCEIPMVSYSRARLLRKLGLKSIRDVASADANLICRRREVVGSKDTSFPAAFQLIVNYAQAICRRRPLVVGNQSILPERSRRPFFMDLEYDPVGTGKRGAVGIFLCGIMDSDGNITQRFLDDPGQERDLVAWFSDWLSKNRPFIITYSSKSADEPHLRNSLRKFSMSTGCLSDAQFLDLYYDVIFTQSPLRQKIFLPLKGSISSKRVAYHFGFHDHKGTRIHDGLDALLAYNRFLLHQSKKIRNDLLAYNRSDLKRTALIYERIQGLFERYRRNETAGKG
jgi:predicted RecB family nuclease